MDDDDETVPWIWIVLAIIVSFAVFFGIVYIAFNFPMIVLFFIGVAMIVYGVYLIHGGIKGLRGM